MVRVILLGALLLAFVLMLAPSTPRQQHGPVVDPADVVSHIKAAIYRE